MQASTAFFWTTTYLRERLSKLMQCYTKPPKCFDDTVPNAAKRMSFVIIQPDVITGTTSPNIHQHRKEVPFVPRLCLYTQMPTIRHPDPALSTGSKSSAITSSVDIELPEHS